MNESRQFIVLSVLTMAVLLVAASSAVQSWRSVQLENRVTQLLLRLQEVQTRVPTESASDPVALGEHAEPALPQRDVRSHVTTDGSRK